ncbi:DNA polymerase III subunit beta [Ornithobacterium rhinotracheale]|uniref:DNA polymerase III subunit beta n=1 Tax=Ornithobacterium rhinotracheale TaxID=28251 RepID=UPI00129CA896|nr:DNA polymerase III subunit beta [Ornithobacterium rhinotracheale]MRI63572.1 DNA polymerase III subunit beta [Ornithobacterium rhinotracheale]
MKFIVASSTLQKHLQMLGGVINSSNTLAILDNFLFELEQDRLKITATDLETTISTVIQVQSEDVESICVPSKILLDTLKTFPDQPLTFLKREDNQLEIVSDQGKYQLSYLSSEDFPETPVLPDVSSTTIPSDVLVEALNKTIFATSNDTHRPVMTGVYFEWNSNFLQFVGTDAHRLVKYTRHDLQSTDGSDFIMPKKPMNILKNILPSGEDVVVDYNENNARFSVGNMTITCRLVDGKYPAYGAVIPKENPKVMTINRTMFLNSLRRVSIFANKSTYLVRLKLNGNQLTINSEDADFANKAEEKLPCDYHGEEFQIGFNAKFLSEILQNLQSEDITLSMSEPSRAGIIKPVGDLEEGEEILMLVMPLMLSAK